MYEWLDGRVESKPHLRIEYLKKQQNIKLAVIRLPQIKHPSVLAIGLLYYQYYYLFI